MAELQVQKVNWWHERLADWMIANPHQNMKDAANYFDCHIQTLYIIKNSDSFKQYWAGRSADASSTIVSDVRDKMLAVTEIALDNLAKRMDTQGELMQTAEMVSVATLGMKSLGYTASKQNAPATVNNYISIDLLAEARERMRAQHGIEVAKPKVIEGSVASSELLSD